MADETRAEPAPDPAPVRRRARWPLVLAGVAIALVAAGVGAAVEHQLADQGSARGTCLATRTADRGLPSVVTVFAAGGGNSGSGTGELVRAGGYILTNEHVINVAANNAGGTLSVLYSDGHRSDATLVGRDVPTDLAVLKAADGGGGLPLIAWGSSGALRVGQPVVALGAPLGLSSTVTAGIVSALGRSLTVPTGENATAHLMGAIQTDASINPGNSGGPLVDCSARMVGVNTAIATAPSASGQSGGGSIGLGFAIPSDLARPLSDELIEHGTVDHPTFGLDVQTIPQGLEAQGVPAGLFVVSVDPGGPAEQAGIRAGDIITELDGGPARDAEQLVVLTLKHDAGDQVDVTYVRDGHESSATVTLASSRAS